MCDLSRGVTSRGVIFRGDVTPRFMRCDITRDGEGLDILKIVLQYEFQIVLECFVT